MFNNLGLALSNRLVLDTDWCLIQKQPSRRVLRKWCSENIQQIYRRTPMPKYDFNKNAKQLYCIEITLRHGCS